MNTQIKITECPRDAMQGIKSYIPTTDKVRYINSLLKVGFDTLDFGSFVSPKAIPQMADTKDVLAQLDMGSSKTKLLAIIANYRGAEEAAAYEQITYLGFPFSISETFQKRNTNSTIAESMGRVEEIQNLCVKANKQMVVYISMAFGNSYNDPWNADIAIEWTEKIAERGVKIFAMADTVGVSNPENISYLFKNIIPKFPQLQIGAHLHTTPTTWREKMEAALNAGVTNFDAALKGYGGCPMAADDLTGNMPTENIVALFDEMKISHHLNKNYFLDSMQIAETIFPH
ncbi:MAG: hydroxymethylglutaryl-CoA lyase [Bacteroidetes bacterium]|nr:hydroxymethylglutaryl-CoA lyase [Bacteroidota bacterium]